MKSPLLILESLPETQPETQPEFELIIDNKKTYYFYYFHNCMKIFETQPIEQMVINNKHELLLQITYNRYSSTQVVARNFPILYGAIVDEFEENDLDYTQWSPTFKELIQDPSIEQIKKHKQDYKWLT